MKSVGWAKKKQQEIGRKIVTKEKQLQRKKEKMHVALLVFLIIICVLSMALLVLVLINAIKRVCDSKPTNDENAAKTRKVVDLFVAQYSELPHATLRPGQHLDADVSPMLICGGMTALIDRGMYNLETGIYMLQNNNVWVPIGVPEVGDQFFILRGPHARKQHTIRPSFMQEVRPPTETQVFTTTSTVQVLQETTSTVFVQADVIGGTQVAVNQSGMTHHAQNSVSTGRTLNVINTSPKYACLLVFKPFADNISVPAKTISNIHLQLKSNIEGCFFYEPVAQS